jgi:hypothetical protein
MTTIESNFTVIGVPSLRHPSLFVSMQNEIEREGSLEKFQEESQQED